MKSKLKTKKSAAKRFRLTGTGKVRRHHSHASHILTKKSSKRKRKLRKPSLAAAGDVERVMRMLKLK